jgi:hypothetical protein
MDLAYDAVQRTTDPFTATGTFGSKRRAGLEGAGLK